MAQGRVAHLIEWKGWGGGGEARGGWNGTRGKGGGGWGGIGAELQEDEQFYSQMTDEIKEARFAAGETEGRFYFEKKTGCGQWRWSDAQVPLGFVSVRLAPAEGVSTGINSPYHVPRQWLKSSALIRCPFVWDCGRHGEKTTAPIKSDRNCVRVPFVSQE